MHFTAYDPVAGWTGGHVVTKASAQSATALLDKLQAHMPFRVIDIQVDGGSEFMADFEQACLDRALLYSFCRRNARSRAAASHEPRVLSATNYTSTSTCPTASTSCNTTSMPSPTGSTTIGHTKLLATEPQPSTSLSSAADPRVWTRSIAAVLSRESVVVATSMVGRILRELMDRAS